MAISLTRPALWEVPIFQLSFQRIFILLEQDLHSKEQKLTANTLKGSLHIISRREAVKQNNGRYFSPN